MLIHQQEHSWLSCYTYIVLCFLGYQWFGVLHIDQMMSIEDANKVSRTIVILQVLILPSSLKFVTHLQTYGYITWLNSLILTIIMISFGQNTVSPTNITI